MDACIGAGNSGTRHMILLEKYPPGSVVAFCDLDRTSFNRIVEGYLSSSSNFNKEAGDFKMDSIGLRKDLKDIPFYTNPEEIFAKENSFTAVFTFFEPQVYEFFPVKEDNNLVAAKPRLDIKDYFNDEKGAIIRVKIFILDEHY